VRNEPEHRDFGHLADGHQPAATHSEHLVDGAAPNALAASLPPRFAIFDTKSLVNTK
jgi:hypothetical protein